MSAHVVSEFSHEMNCMTSECSNEWVLVSRAERTDVAMPTCCAHVH